MKVSKKSRIIALLSMAVLLTACSFIGTTKKDMEEVSSVTDGYEEYSAERFEELNGSEKFLLFFHADWCPTCRILESRLKKDLGILNGHTILEANYDREIDLKKEYNVAVQTTVIFFNADGSIEDKRVNPRLSQIEEFFQ